ncbi:hypothetical protein GINT2_000138 [Glugoides intestinalis]
MIEKSDVICLKLLSRGSFFEEYLVCIDSAIAKLPKFKLRAMRKPLIALNKTDEDVVMFELMIRSSIRHSFLNNQICAFQDYNNLYHVSEYAPVLLLDSNIIPKKVSSEIAKFYATEMFLCLKYLHAKKQNYTFLSKKNLFLSADGHVKLEYAFCNCIECSSTGILDDLEYLSPDYLENHRFSPFSDYWSLGIVIYQLLHGYPPFTGNSVELTIAEIKKCTPVFEDEIDEDSRSIINLLLDRANLEKYPTCEELENAIQFNPFFSNIDWEMFEKKECTPPFIIIPPEYNISSSPRLSTLYTSDFIVPGKDGYGNIFANYNTVHYLNKKREIHKHHRKSH